MTQVHNMSETYTPNSLPTFKFTVPRNSTYHYIRIPPSQPTKSTILILHGFPSIPADFHHQIQILTSHGYGILSPYLLGYHPTSTPTSPSAYLLKCISTDLISLLDHLNLIHPIPAIGHDFGVTLLSRLEYYHPSRISKLAYLTISPSPFGAPFDLDKVNQMTRQMMGYEGFGYQKFFMDDVEGAAGLLSEKHDRMEKLMFAEDSTGLWRDYFGRIGGLRKWLPGEVEVDGEEAGDVRQISGVSKELLRKRRESFVPGQKSLDSIDDFGPGYLGPLLWYVALNTNVNLQDERNEKSDWEMYKTNKPVLMVLSNKDPIALPNVHLDMIGNYVESEEQLRVEKLESGHFVILEKADKLSEILTDFVAE